MEVLVGGSAGEFPKVMNLKTLVFKVLFPKWAFFSSCTIWLVNRGTKRFKPVNPSFVLNDGTFHSWNWPWDTLDLGWRAKSSADPQWTETDLTKPHHSWTGSEGTSHTPPSVRPDFNPKQNVLNLRYCPKAQRHVLEMENTQTSIFRHFT